MVDGPADPTIETQRGRDLADARLTAFHQAADDGTPMPAIVPASRWREWMSATRSHFANRCLPLLMANEAGWALLNPIAFEARWNGGDDRYAVSVEFDGDVLPPVKPVGSLFGYGILTWSIPYLFRTPPGFNLLARGPANWPKDGICSLEGLVETDWSMATFTMNWKLTRADHPVRFEQDEPFCVIVPQRRGELESFEPRRRPVRSDPATAQGWLGWLESRDDLQRRKFLSEYSDEFATARDEWESDYFRGRNAGGEAAPEHQTKLRLRDFVDDSE